MKYCAHCGKEILDDAVVCPNCGCEVNKTKKVAQTSNDGAGIASLVLGILSIVLSSISYVIFGFLSIIALILSIIGIVNSSKSRKLNGSNGKNIAGLVLNIIGIIESSSAVILYILVVAAVISSAV